MTVFPLEPFYTLPSCGRGFSPDWGFKFNLTVLFPELKRQF